MELFKGADLGAADGVTAKLVKFIGAFTELGTKLPFVINIFIF